MERRDFLRSILGVAAATALPSEVWPFRKIFIPSLAIWDVGNPVGLYAGAEISYLTAIKCAPGAWFSEEISAQELKASFDQYQKQIAELTYGLD